MNKPATEARSGVNPFTKNRWSSQLSRHYRHWALTIKPMIEFQLCLLRLWADNMESVAQNYEKGLQTANSAIEQQWQQQHAA